LSVATTDTSPFGNVTLSPIEAVTLPPALAVAAVASIPISTLPELASASAHAPPSSVPPEFASDSQVPWLLGTWRFAETSTEPPLNVVPFATSALTFAFVFACALETPTSTPPNAPPLAIADAFGVKLASTTTALVAVTLGVPPELLHAVEAASVPRQALAASKPEPSPLGSESTFAVASEPSPLTTPPENACAIALGASVSSASMQSDEASFEFPQLSEPDAVTPAFTYATPAPSASAVAEELAAPTMPTEMFCVLAYGATYEAISTSTVPAALSVPPETYACTDGFSVAFAVASPAPMIPPAEETAIAHAPRVEMHEPELGVVPVPEPSTFAL
jgi:hypothetical protein